MNALIDTDLLLDYLSGDERAARALSDCAHRSITVVTWLEVMRASPPDRREATRSFLRSFERLSISESSTDEAMRLSFAHPGLCAARAINWANAVVNQLVFLTTDAAACPASGRDVLIPYAGSQRAAEPAGRRRADKPGGSGAGTPNAR